MNHVNSFYILDDILLQIIREIDEHYCDGDMVLLEINDMTYAAVKVQCCEGAQDDGFIPCYRCRKYTQYNVEWCFGIVI